MPKIVINQKVAKTKGHITIKFIFFLDKVNQGKSGGRASGRRASLNENFEQRMLARNGFFAGYFPVFL